MKGICLEKEDLSRSIKKILQDKNISFSRIMLFGSRALENNTDDSDWDILILIENGLSTRERMDLSIQLSRALHNEYPLEPVDIIVKTTQQFEEEKSVMNTISSEAFLEGIIL